MYMKNFLHKKNLNFFDLGLILLCLIIAGWAIVFDYLSLFEKITSNRVSAQDAIATLVNFKKDVRIRKNSIYFWKQIQTDDYFLDRESIFVGNESSATLQLPHDETFIELDENTILSLHASNNSEPQEVIIKRGNIRIKNKNASSFVINKTKIQMKANSEIKLNKLQQSLQIETIKGEAKVNQHTMSQGQVSDGQDVVQRCELLPQESPPYFSFNGETPIKFHIRHPQEIKPDRVELIIQGENGENHIWNNTLPIENSFAIGKYNIFAKVYQGKKLIAQSPSRSIQVHGLSPLEILFPREKEVLKIREHEKLTLRWNNDLENLYQIKLLNASNHEVIEEEQTHNSFRTVILPQGDYLLKIAQFIEDQKIRTVERSFSIQYLPLFHAQILAPYFFQNVLLNKEPLLLPIKFSEKFQVHKIRLRLSETPSFEQSQELKLENNQIKFPLAGKFHVKLLWEQNGIEKEEILAEPIEVLDLEELLRAPIIIESNFHFQLIPISNVWAADATKALKWKDTASQRFPIKYRLEVANNPDFINAKIIETERQKISIAQKEYTQYWRVQRLVHINGKLYLGQYSTPALIAALPPIAASAVQASLVRPTKPIQKMEKKRAKRIKKHKKKKQRKRKIKVKKKIVAQKEKKEQGGNSLLQVAIIRSSENFVQPEGNFTGSGLGYSLAFHYRLQRFKLQLEGKFTHILGELPNNGDFNYREGSGSLGRYLSLTPKWELQLFLKEESFIAQNLGETQTNAEIINFFGAGVAFSYRINPALQFGLKSSYAQSTKGSSLISWEGSALWRLSPHWSLGPTFIRKNADIAIVEIENKRQYIQLDVNYHF